MPAKKLPDTDEERIRALETIIHLEENAKEKNTLSLREIHDLKSFLLAYDRLHTRVKHALADEMSSEKNCFQLMQNAQLYISHFIQVLYLATVRNEIKADNLAYYGLEYSEDFTLPDLSTEDNVVEWGERLINGETMRTSQGGAPIYNPTITKVKVHYDLFKEAVYSLKIYRQNTHRNRENMENLHDKADSLIWTAWTKVEFAYGALPSMERDKKYHEYGIQFYYQTGEY